MKIDKYIGRSGFTSRRKAFVLIEEQRVFVNNKVANFSTKVNEGDVVLIDGKELKAAEFVPVYLAYNKPRGVVCTTEKIKGNIIDAINFPSTIYPVGRLDKESEGLIILTNHSELIDKIANPQFEHEKEYIVTLNFPLRDKFLEEISQGIEIMGEMTKPCTVLKEPESKRIFRITLKQGMNRQIRRMCNAYDYQVLKLQRVRVMHIELGKLKLGEWRHLSEDELTLLFQELNLNPA
jgi:23S rRNA pseudouridine2604 synthase